MRKDTLTIDEYTYTITQWGTRAATGALVRSFRCFGPAMGAAFGGQNIKAIQSLAAEAVALAAAKKSGAVPQDAKPGSERLLDLLSGFDIASIAKAISTSVEIADVEALQEALAERTTFSRGIKGTSTNTGAIPLAAHFDEHFAGRPYAMWYWLAFGLRLNFADFLSAAALSQE